MPQHHGVTANTPPTDATSHKNTLSFSFWIFTLQFCTLCILLSCFLVFSGKNKVKKVEKVFVFGGVSLSHFSCENVPCLISLVTSVYLLLFILFNQAAGVLKLFLLDSLLITPDGALFNSLFLFRHKEMSSFLQEVFRTFVFVVNVVPLQK